MKLTKIDGTNRLYELECLRGFAAVYVVAFHVLRPELQTYSYLLSVPFRFGQEAVIIFFLLSGFVIHYSWTGGARQDWRSYASARIVRILPIFLAALGISYLCAASLAGSLIDPDWRALAGNLAMLQDRPREGTIVEPYMDNEALWSLSYECAFYLFYVVVMRVVPTRRRTAVVAGVSAAAFLLMLAFPNQLARFLAYFSIWWLGVVLCDLYLGRARHRDLFLAGAPVAFIAAILLLLAFRSDLPIEVGASVFFPVLELRHFLGALCAVGALVLWARLGWRGFATLLGPFAVLAPISYALYVVHFPIMTAWREGLSLPFWPGVLVTAAITLALAIVLEGPYQRWAGRYLRILLDGPPPATDTAVGGPLRLPVNRQAAIVVLTLSVGLGLNLVIDGKKQDHPPYVHTHRHAHDPLHAHGHPDTPGHSHAHSHEAVHHAHDAG